MAKHVSFGKVVLIIVIIAMMVYAGATFWVIKKQHDLLFNPVSGKLPPFPYSDIDCKRVELVTLDSVKLIGWAIAAPPEDTLNQWLIYFHDQGKTVASDIDEYMYLRSMGLNILAVDYRGYGESEGTPDEAGLYADAGAMYYYLRYIKKVPSLKIILYGTGLGTAAAIDVAVKVNAAAVVAVSGFTSAPELIQSWYPYLPIKPFIHTKFNSLDKIKKINTPKFFVYSPVYKGISAEDSRQLYEAATKYMVYLQPPDSSTTESDLAFFSKLAKALNTNSLVHLTEPNLSRKKVTKMNNNNQ